MQCDPFTAQIVNDHICTESWMLCTHLGERVIRARQ